MTFATIAFLAALPLALAPLVLHFFDRRRNVVIPWGAMQFLEEAIAKRTSSQKLKQWLLLLMRTLAILLLVLAVAGPFLPTEWIGGTGGRTQWIYIIDNSMSLSAAKEDVNVELLSKLKTDVSSAVESLPNADAVRLLAASPTPTWLNEDSPRLTPLDRDRIRGELSELQSTTCSSDLLSAVLAAVQAETTHPWNAREIVVLTDGQAVDWQLEDRKGWSRFQQALQASPIATRIRIVQTEASQDRSLLPNLAVTEITSSRATVAPEQKVLMKATIRNFSDRSSPPCAIRWSAAASRDELGRSELYVGDIPEIEPGGSFEARRLLAFTTHGTQLIQASIEAHGSESEGLDLLAADNANVTVVNVRKQIPILLVEADDAPASIVRQDSYYVQAGLGHIGRDDARWKSVYTPTIVNHRQLESVTLDRFHCVVIPHLHELSNVARERLESFVRQGGGLWIGLGPATGIQEYNDQMFQSGAGLAPLPLAGIDDHLLKQSLPAMDASLEPHRVNERLQDDRRLDLADVEVQRNHRFVMNDGQSTRQAATLLTLSDGTPIAVEKALGEGRIVAMAIPLNRTWSELALSQSFVVLLEDYLGYLAEPSMPKWNLTAGEPLQASASHVVLEAPATLSDPWRRELELTPEPSASGLEFRTAQTRLPGIYEMQVDALASPPSSDPNATESPAANVANASIRNFVVRRGAKESRVALLDPTTTELLAERSGMRDSLATSPDFGSSQRRPIWPLLFVLLLALAAAELALASSISRSRQPSLAPAHSTPVPPMTGEAATSTVKQTSASPTSERPSTELASSEKGE